MKQIQEILTREDIQRLYDEGKTEEALRQIGLVLPEWDDPEEVEHLYAIKAWCHYRRKEYDLCRQAIVNAGNGVKAKECLAQLTAYVDKDDDLLAQIVLSLPDNVGVANAYMIRARDKDSVITHEGVMEVVRRLLGSDEISATNLVNNAGRFFLAKKRHQADLFTALGLQEMAFIRYGEGSMNLHHRAALLFWQSKIVQELSGTEAARTPARGSLHLWERQANLDPTNPAFQTGLENSKKRLAELGVDWTTL